MVGWEVCVWRLGVREGDGDGGCEMGCVYICLNSVGGD